MKMDAILRKNKNIYYGIIINCNIAEFKFNKKFYFIHNKIIQLSLYDFIIYFYFKFFNLFFI